MILKELIGVQREVEYGKTDSGRTSNDGTNSGRANRRKIRTSLDRNESGVMRRSGLLLLATSFGLLSAQQSFAGQPGTQVAFQPETQVEVTPMNSLEGSMLYWVKLRESLKNMVVAPYSVAPNGRRIALPLESISSDLRVSRTSAEWNHNGKALRATMTESPDSDGGDLWNLTIEELDSATAQAGWQPVARAENVLAFGDVLLAIFGGRSEQLDAVIRN